MWQEAREELFLLRHPPFQVLPVMLCFRPQFATPEVTDGGQMRKFLRGWTGVSLTGDDGIAA